MLLPVLAHSAPPYVLTADTHGPVIFAKTFNILAGVPSFAARQFQLSATLMSKWAELSSVPEPGKVALLIAGILVLAWGFTRRPRFR